MGAVKLNRLPKNKSETNNLKSYLPNRFYFAIGFVLTLAIALVAKSSHLQVFDAEKLIKAANDRSIRNIELPFTRGKILDRNGRILSISVPMYSITLNPKAYFDHHLARNKIRWQHLAKETGSSASRIQAKVNEFIKEKKKRKYDAKMIFDQNSDGYWQLLAAMTGVDLHILNDKVRHNPHSSFMQLEKKAIARETEKLQTLANYLDIRYNALMKQLYSASEQGFIYLSRHQSDVIADSVQKLNMATLILKKEPRRFYPLAEEVAQLVGFTDIDDKGAEGLELSFDAMLVGRNGKQIIRKDQRGNVVEHIRDEKQYDPQDLILSIDEDLQSMAYREIKKAMSENKAESGIAVLVDVQTGEILAMANAPSYNPNNRNEFKVELAANRAITDTFEPGSTVKPLMVLTALQHKVTYPDEVINTRPFTVNGHTIKDVAPRESLTLTGILQKSSNIGVSRLALRMPPTALLDTYNKVGFGKDTGLGLGESRGSKGDRSRWSDIERATLAYGYGLNVTPLQLARAYATLGSFGIYRPLSITKVDPPVIGERTLPEKITRDVVKMMESVAQKGEGGQRAAVDGFRIAVKTGTTHKLEKGKYVYKYLAYTAGIAPASNPRFALVILINEPKAGNYYGGAVSAQIFSKIMGHTLKARNIKPDNITDNRQVIHSTQPQAVN